MVNPSTFLIGTGVVGRAILAAHVDAGLSVCVADQEAASVLAAISDFHFDSNVWQVSPAFELARQLHGISIQRAGESVEQERPLVIESIPERLDIKQAFFREAEQIFGDHAVLCSNTSTLRISQIASTLAHPQRVCGMHFFMPVQERGAVELVRSELTDDATMNRALEHVRRLNKNPLVVSDSPGFIVNRLLTPYLNEAMLMLGRGVSAEMIQKAAIGYGMPFTPLELIDWIGLRTMFDAGRVFWQAFPSRIDPSPIVPAMIKNKRLGRSYLGSDGVGRGLFDYVGGHRSETLAVETRELCQRYRKNFALLEEDEVRHILSIPMWIEAAIALREGIVSRIENFDLAMRGGLGYAANQPWLDYFDALGSKRIRSVIDRWSPQIRSLQAPDELRKLLESFDPTQTMEHYRDLPTT